MTAHKLIRNPLWAILVGVLVAAMVASFFVYVQSGEAAPNTADRQTPKIVGGKEVPNGKYPFFAALLDTRLRGNAFDQQICGGTLIDKDSVLTAAHCFFNPKSGNLDPQSVKAFQVVVGRTVLDSSQGQVRSVKSRFIHPNYNPKSASLDYDAAVLGLKKPVSGIPPIKLATAAQNNLEQAGRNATVAGWGSVVQVPACSPPNNEPAYANRMREAQVPIVSDSEANQLFRNICPYSGALRTAYTPTLMVAAGGIGKDACQADSGGPLFIANAVGGKDTQIGIVSFGPGCAPDVYPNAYTEVNASPIASFIQRAAQ
jgi:secreted trypsin-like serine protease